MANKTQLLYDEVLTAMVAEKVDPFERDWRPKEDFLITTAVSNSITAPPARHDMQRLRDFSKNLKYVEAKSRAKTQAQSTTHKKRKASKKKLKPSNIQVTRRPFETAFCSINPLPSGKVLFDGDICYAMHPISQLVQEAGLEFNFDNFGSISPAKQSELMSPLRHPSHTGKNGEDLPPVSPLKPTRKLKIGYGDIGSSVRGGLMTQGPARPAPIKSTTQNSSLFTTEELDGGQGSRLRPVKGCGMSSAIRFPKSQTDAKGSGPGGLNSPVVDHSCNFKGKFSSAPRFKDSSTTEDPVGPGSYNPYRLFENQKPRLSTKRAESLIDKISKEEGIKKFTCKDLVTEAVFGFGCSYEEHAKYGMCLDGQCAKRGEWEEIMMITDDRTRLGGAKKKDGCKFSDTDVARGARHPQPINLRSGGEESNSETCSPMKSACLAGDLDTVVKLCILGEDINEVDPERNESAMHHCVRRNYLHLLRALTGGSGGWDEEEEVERNPLCADCAHLFKGKVDVNVQNCDGETALHIAARDGLMKLVETLCDAGADPMRKNHKGKSPADVAKDMPTFQMLKMYGTLRDTERELRKMQKERMKSENQLKNMQHAKSRISTAAKSRRESFQDRTIDSPYSADGSLEDNEVDGAINSSSESSSREMDFGSERGDGPDGIDDFLSSLREEQGAEIELINEEIADTDTADSTKEVPPKQQKAFGRGHSFEVGHIVCEPCHYDIGMGKGSKSIAL